MIRTRMIGVVESKGGGGSTGGKAVGSRIDPGFGMIATGSTAEDVVIGRFLNGARRVRAFTAVRVRERRRQQQRCGAFLR